MNQLERVAALSTRVVRFVQRVALVFLVSAAAAWMLWLLPETLSILPMVFAALGLVVLAVPGVVYLLFAGALSGLAELPSHIQTKALEGGRHAATAVANVPGVGSEKGNAVTRLGRLLKALYGIGRSGIDAKGAIVGAVGTVKLFNPIVLLTIVASGVFGTLLTLAALVSLIVVLL